MDTHINGNLNTYTPKILIIEDNHYDFLLLKNIIHAKFPKVEILYAADLAGAYNIYKEQSYDFILLDLNLPDGYGLGTIQEVKKFHGHTPIIAVTGMMTETIERNAQNMGAEQVISKDKLLHPSFFDTIHPFVTSASTISA